MCCNADHAGCSDFAKQLQIREKPRGWCIYVSSKAASAAALPQRLLRRLSVLLFRNMAEAQGNHCDRAIRRFRWSKHSSSLTDRLELELNFSTWTRYAAIAPDHPSSFQYWIRTRLAWRKYPAMEDPLPQWGCVRFASQCVLMRNYSARPLYRRVAFVGFGEEWPHRNSMSPPVADFNDLEDDETDHARRGMPPATGGRGPFPKTSILYHWEALSRLLAPRLCSVRCREICNVPDLRKGLEL